ncbi:hypothetical protein LUZ61_018979 [Rhynchospora tenuis]|uniref:RING-type E3 ubiquitin transferase n=1 Tax=Rhynchospora tenuis TaxID=198213 RepID=A0AAD5ZAB0_9POAL|nr:hypothetical protein LUZ61_018979 [Rhynchospora tenuis]
MAAESNAHKVFVALPARYEDGLSVLSWALSHFPVDITKIIITHVMISPFKASPRASFDPKPWLIEKENMVLHLNKYISHCAIYKFRAEKLVHVADNVADGIVQVISQYGTKNLVMRSSTNSGMTDLASETAKKVMQKAHRSCKLWFFTGGNLIFTREVYSYKLTSAPIYIPEERPHWNRRSTEASSSTFGTSNTNIREEGNIDGVDALLNKISNEATREANSFEQIAEEMDILVVMT